MLHTYIDAAVAKQEFINLYKEKQGKITIAFNFNTVHFNEAGAGENYGLIVKVLIKLRDKGAILECYTTETEGDKATWIENVKHKLFSSNLECVVTPYISTHADIIVDQRCGLSQVYDELVALSQIEL